MDQKQSRAIPEGRNREKLQGAIEDLPARKLGVHQEDAVKGGLRAQEPNEFP